MSVVSIRLCFFNLISIESIGIDVLLFFLLLLAIGFIGHLLLKLKRKDVLINQMHDVQSINVQLLNSQLIEQNRQLAVLLEFLPGFVYSRQYQHGWTTQFISNEVETITGYEPHAFMRSGGLTFHSLIFNKDRLYVEQIIDESIQHNKPFLLEYRIKDRLNKTVWVAEKGCAVYDENGNVIAIESYVSDISEQKVAMKDQLVVEKKYSQLFRQMINGLVIYKPLYDAEGKVYDFRYEEMNPAFDIHSSIASYACLGKTILEVQGSEGESIVRQYIDIFEKGEPCQYEIYNAIFDKYLSIHAFIPAPNSFAVLFHDISNAARLHKALKLSEEKYRMLFESIFSGFAYCEPIYNSSGAMIDFKFIECNDAFKKHIGIVDDVIGLQGKKMKIRCFDELMPLFADVCSTGKSKTEEQFNKVLNRYFRISVYSQVNNCFAILLDDISERKQMQQRIIDTMIETEENERHKLASDLHDEIGPMLSSMRIYSSSLQRKIEDSKALEIMELLSRLIDNSIDKIREISHNLSPTILKRYGLVSAIVAECELIELIVPIEFNHNIKHFRFDSRIETTIYRIVKELLNNTKKHAEATQSMLNIQYKDHLLELYYHDNGVGFNETLTDDKSLSGMGLLNIEMRVRSINGEYSMESKPGEGYSFHMKAVANVLPNLMSDID